MKEDGRAAVGMRSNEARVNTKGVLGYVDGVDRGAEAGFRSSVGPILGSSFSGSRIIGTGQIKGDISFKSLGKRHVGSDGFPQKDKDLRNKFSISKSISLLPSAGLAQTKVGDARTSGPSNEKLGGPREERPEQADPLASNGLTPSGLDITFFNGQNIILDKQCFGGMSSNDLSEQELVEVQSVSSGNAGNNLVLNNPMFKGPSESYNREHKPDLVGFLETRVSGVKVDSVIAKLSFDFSYHVEAVGFSGGIWIGWKDTISVDILGNHSQFILLRISGNSYQQPVLVTFVYGSLNGKKRKQLWEALKYTVLVDGTMWLAIGDFNAILASCEKRGGRVIGKRCALFSEFMDSMGLHDLGFSGPNFTWNRGGVFERLDRAI
ncbi:Endonuclease/exonuclease/phosphatase [Gossypium australe]|uniref:Endonuclease/exonuclease/phosphatase n=1 Tax=Gossypium australe TaxID=47621 RepID=A0A5B6X1M5_9ROSI|nr:Endonuclease/exonuclease/phosphatase [Gossypium australe]